MSTTQIVVNRWCMIDIESVQKILPSSKFMQICPGALWSFLFGMFIYILYVYLLLLLLLFFIFYRLLMYGNFYLLCILSRITCDTKIIPWTFHETQNDHEGLDVGNRERSFPKTVAVPVPLGWYPSCLNPQGALSKGIYPINTHYI